MLKGYLADDLADSFARYLPSATETPTSNRYAATSRAQSGDEPVFRSATTGDGSVSEDASNPATGAAGSAVADKHTEYQEGEEFFEDDDEARSHERTAQVSFL